MYFKFTFIIDDFTPFPSMFYNVKSIFCHSPVRCMFVVLLVMVGCFVVFLVVVWVSFVFVFVVVF